MSEGINSIYHNPFYHVVTQAHDSDAAAAAIAASEQNFYHPLHFHSHANTNHQRTSTYSNDFHSTQKRAFFPTTKAINRIYFSLLCSSETCWVNWKKYCLDFFSSCFTVKPFFDNIILMKIKKELDFLNSLFFINMSFNKLLCYSIIKAWKKTGR